jgi:catechol 2,3-dioxygenase-like lactoylglutathione lyase family enzyme
MKVIPVIRCSDISKSLTFYTDILDFEIKQNRKTVRERAVTIQNGVAEMQLSASDGIFGNHVNIRVDNIDRLFKKYVKRGLQISNSNGTHANDRVAEQPHSVREFHVNDPDGNTLRFIQPV